MNRRIGIAILVFAACYNCAQINAPASAGTLPELGRIIRRLRRNDPTWKLYHKLKGIRAGDASSLSPTLWNFSPALVLATGSLPSTVGIVARPTGPLLGNAGEMPEFASTVKACLKTDGCAVSRVPIATFKLAEPDELNGSQMGDVRYADPATSRQIGSPAISVWMLAAHTMLPREQPGLQTGYALSAGLRLAGKGKNNADAALIARLNSITRSAKRSLRLMAVGVLAAVNQTDTSSLLTTSITMAQKNGAQKSIHFGKLNGAAFRRNTNCSAITATVQKGSLGLALTHGPRVSVPIRERVRGGRLLRWGRSDKHEPGL